MAAERDAERLARISLLFAEMKNTLTRMAPNDRLGRQHLSDQLDKMLDELRGPSDVPRRRP